MADINLTLIKTFVSGEPVTPAKLNALGQSTVALTAGSIVAADIADAAVTTAKLAAVTAQSLLPAGAVMPFARATAPAGWLIANGDAVPNGSGTVQGVTADFSALYAAVSTSFGTAGTLPDLRGIFVRGSDSQVIAGVTYTGAALGGKQGDSFRTHTHAASTDSTGAHTHSVNTSVGTSGAGGGLAVASPTSNEIPTARISTASSGAHTHTVTVTATGGTETSPANITLLYCIKF